MVTEFLTGAGAFLATGATLYIGYAFGRHSTDEDDLRSADALEDARTEGFNTGWKEAEGLADSMYAGDWDQGYNAGLEAGRAATNPDPAALTLTATVVREARQRWLRYQTENYLSSYRDLFWRLIVIARDIGERYRKVESLGRSGLVPIGDALNLCIYVADTFKHYEDHKILDRPHQGVFEGKAS